jgi:hypothetical protein
MFLDLFSNYVNCERFITSGYTNRQWKMFNMLRCPNVLFGIWIDGVVFLSISTYLNSVFIFIFMFMFECWFHTTSWAFECLHELIDWSYFIVWICDRVWRRKP